MFDTNWNKTTEKTTSTAAAPGSIDYPGVLFYSGFTCNGHRSGVALECQYYPDAMCHGNFPSVVLPAGKPYEETTVYKFDVIKYS